MTTALSSYASAQVLTATVIAALADHITRALPGITLRPPYTNKRNKPSKRLQAHVEPQIFRGNRSDATGLPQLLFLAVTAWQALAPG
jgi:hypothetical protein